MAVAHLGCSSQPFQQGVCQWQHLKLHPASSKPPGNRTRPRPRLIVSIAESDAPETAVAPAASTRPTPKTATSTLLTSTAPAYTNSQQRRNSFIEAGICRAHTFAPEQLEVLTRFADTLAQCRTSFAVVAVFNVLIDFVLVEEGHASGPTALFQTVTVGDVANWADSVLAAFLLNFTIKPFQQAAQPGVDQMAHTFQGLSRLGLVFQQLAIASFAVSSVTCLEASAKWPGLVVGASGMFLVLAVLRSAAVWYVLGKYTASEEEVLNTLATYRSCSERAQEMNVFDRAAVQLAFGFLLEYEGNQSSHKQAAQSSHNEEQCYEFNAKEEQLLRTVTQSANTAALALGLQTFATFLLVLGDYAAEEYVDVASDSLNAGLKLTMALLLFRGANNFDKALHTEEGDGVSHLLNGLGEHSMTELFKSLSVLGWAVSLTTVLGLLIPAMEESPWYTVAGDKITHTFVEYSMDGLRLLTRIFKGV